MRLQHSLSLFALAAAAAMPAAAQQTSQPLGEADVVALTDWTYDRLYAEGISAETFIDEMAVHDPSGEDIGDVEDILIGHDGKVLAIVAEVGGLWDIGDTHVSVPIDLVQVIGDAARVPVTEETVDDYDFWGEDEASAAEAGAVGSEVVTGIDDVDLPRAWRATELIGDRARLTDGDGYANYGYVSDLILRDGQVAAVVIDPAGAWGTGYRAYPYYGYGWGWNPGAPTYDMPYGEDDVGDVQTFDYDQLRS